MSIRIVPRTEIGLPKTVYSSNGYTRRPALKLPVVYLTVHYTGVTRSYTNADVGDTIVDIHRYHMANEYNYVIGQQDDNKVFEFAGLFRGAHSGGENSIAIGVLMLNGVNDPLSNAQVNKFLWLRSQLEAWGATVNVVPTPHRNMPGAATACPGGNIMSRWLELIAPLNSVPENPPIIPEEEEDMNQYYLWRHTGKPHVFLIGGGGVVHLTPAGFRHWRDTLKVPFFEENDAAAFERYIKLIGGE